ncbi:unnamed protein product [Penicillium pancosmium]
MYFEDFIDPTVNIWDVGSPAIESLGENSSLAPIMFMTFPQGLDTLFAISEYEDGTLLEKHRLSKSGVSKMTQFIPSDGQNPKKPSPDGRFIAMPSLDMTDLLLWDTETGQLRKINQTALGNGSHIVKFQCSPNNKLMAIASRDNKLRVLDILTESRILALNASFSISLWYLAPGDSKEIGLIPAGPRLKNIAVSAGGKRLAGAMSYKRELHTWDPIHASDT